MTEVNKPETVANPVAQPDTTIQERILETVNQHKASDAPVTTEAPVVPATGGSSDVASQEAASTIEDATSSALKLIEASTGRKFATAEEAQKYLSNLNKLVGDQSVAKGREAANLIDKWAQQNGKTHEEARQYLADVLINSQVNEPQKPVQSAVVKPTEDKTVSDRLAKLEDANQRLTLEKKYPEAQEVIEEVALIAKAKGVPYVEAYEQSPFKTLLALKKEEEAKKSPIVTPSNRVNMDTKVVTELGKKILSGNSSEADRQALIEAMGLAK